MNELECKDLLEHLPAREKQAIEARYWHKKHLSAVGDLLGVSRQRARQIIKKGQTRFQSLLKQKPSVVPEFVAAKPLFEKSSKRRHLAELRAFAANLEARIGRGATH